VTLVSINAYNCTLDILYAPENTQNDIYPIDVENSWLGFSHNMESIPTKSFTYKKPTVGVWKVKICGPIVENKRDVRVLVMNESPYLVKTHLTSYSTHTSTEFGIVATMKNKLTGDTLSSTEQEDPFVADLDIITPNGEQFIVSMHDDGRNNDAKPNDGTFGGKFFASQQGTYTAEVVIKGSHQGVPFVRSTQHMIAVVDKDIELSSEHTLLMDPNDADEDMIIINLKAENLYNKKLVGNKYKAHAQVWGTNLNSTEMVPVAWIAGMTVAESTGVDDSHINLPLKLNKRWIEKAAATFPLQLRNAYVQDVSTSTPITTLDIGHIQHGSLTLKASTTNDEESLHYGKRPLTFMSSSSSSNTHKILLVHGYCSAVNSFDKTLISQTPSSLRIH